MSLDEAALRQHCYAQGHPVGSPPDHRHGRLPHDARQDPATAAQGGDPGEEAPGLPPHRAACHGRQRGRRIRERPGPAPSRRPAGGRGSGPEEAARHGDPAADLLRRGGRGTSLGRAAERLHMAQPAPSLPSRQLEGEPGARTPGRHHAQGGPHPRGQELLDRGRRSPRPRAARGRCPAGGRRLDGRAPAGVCRAGGVPTSSRSWRARSGRGCRRHPEACGVSSCRHRRWSSAAGTVSLDAALLHPPVASPALPPPASWGVSPRGPGPARSRTADRAAVGWRGRPGGSSRRSRTRPGPPLHRAAQGAVPRRGAPPRIGQVAQDMVSMLSLVAAGGGLAPVPRPRGPQLREVVYAELEVALDLALAARRRTALPGCGLSHVTAVDSAEPRARALRRAGRSGPRG
ncbi:hypothetical protein QJS66_17640 [Kocuria rhizophila]|nr:hypothetical protein QJS66_17640 [Kocuria rhizophila]